MHEPAFDSHIASAVLSQQLHSHYLHGKRPVVFAGGKLGLISCDRAPLVAHLLIANSLTCIISDTQPLFGTNPTRAAPTSELKLFAWLFWIWQRNREDIKI